MRWLWCRHHWREVSRYRTFGCLDNVKLKVDRCSERFARQMMFGQTIIGLRCERCGDLKSVELLGQHP